MHRLSASFVLAYHGCDIKVAERLLQGGSFNSSQNDYDWLGTGVYFWEANPLRGLEFAREASLRNPKRIKEPSVVGAVIDLRFCLDLTTSAGLLALRRAHHELLKNSALAGIVLPTNQPERMKHNLDCAVINYLHEIQKNSADGPFDSVKGIFIEGGEIYPGAGFREKNHIQIAIRNPACIKGVFRVPKGDLAEFAN